MVGPVAVPVPLVEIATVRPGMGKDPVQNDADAPLPRFGTEGFEILLRAQERVDAPVVRRVVAVVAVRLEDGVEIDTGDAQLLEIGELLPDAVEIAAVIVVRRVVPAAAVGGVEGLLRPVPVQIDLSPHALVIGRPGDHGGVLAPAEPVREDLVGHRLTEPSGGIVLRRVDGDLPEGPSILPQFPLAGAAAIVIVPSALAQQETVEHEARLLHGPEANGQLLPRRPQGQQPLPCPVLQQQKSLPLEVVRPGGELHLLADRDRTLGAAVGYVQ